MSTPQNSLYNTEGKVERVSLYQPRQRDPVSSSMAADNAQVEVLATGDNSEFEPRMSANQRGAGAFTVEGRSNTVENVMLNMLISQADLGFITENIGLDTIENLSPEDKLARIEFGIARSDLREYSLKEVVAYNLFKSKLHDLPEEMLEDVVRETAVSEIEQLRRSGQQQQTALLRRIVDGFVAAQGWDNWGAAILDVAPEVLPMWPVIAKIGLQRAMLDSIGMPSGDQPKFLLGEGRQLIRDTLVDMTSNERQEAFRNMIEAVKTLQADPTWGPLLTTFNILEQWEAIFTEGVITGDSSKNSWDRFFGNFESAAEALFGALVVRGMSKSLRSVLRVADANKSAQVARIVANRKWQTNAEESLQGEVARVMGIDPDDMIVARLARPQEFVDERTVMMPGVKTLTEGLDRIESEIVRGQIGRLSRIFTKVDRKVTEEKALKAIETGDAMRVAPAMSTIEELEDGVRIRAVLVKNGEENWGSFDELLPDLLGLDPNLEHLTILRRGDDGLLHTISMEPDELARLATNVPENWSDKKLFARIKEVDPDSIEFLQLEREAVKRTGEKSVGAILGDEFFLQYDHFRAYHPTDKLIFGETALRNTSIPFPLLTPNAKFGDELVGAFQENYLVQERTAALFEAMYRPFYKLGIDDKKAVVHMYEWSEDFAKENGIAPSLFDMYAHFGDLTPKQTAGLISLRRGLDTQYEVFNRRLYLEWNGLDYKTAQTLDPLAPRYHGKVLDQSSVKGGTVYDPIKGEEILIRDVDLTTIYGRGGSIMELDIPIDIPGTNGARRSKRILIDGDDYTIGKLSTKPLEYYPGYNFRFYDDPYYITKSNIKGSTLDGVPSTDLGQAIKTAGSQLEAERFLGRIGRRVTDKKGNVSYIDEQGFEYKWERAKDLSQTDNVFKQKQALQREGRLFWDHRQRERLTNVNGNQSEVMDFVKALERGTSLAARVNNEEDVMRAAKSAFVGEFSDLLDKAQLAKFDARALVANLRKQLVNATTPQSKKRAKRALEIAKYIRQLEGVDSAAVPWLRARVLETAVWADRLINNKGFKAGQFKGIEKWAQNLDPLRAARSTAFHLYMVFRPLRQALLQMTQPLFLAGIDPVYVVSGKGLTDSIALRIGITKLRNSAFDPGYSSTWLAKSMGLTKKEYKTLVAEFERSGALDVVDVHSFAGGTSQFHKVALPKGDGLGARAWYGLRSGTRGLTGAMKKYGFDFGEGMNKVGTYNVAWRRVMKNKGYKSLTELTKDDWRQVALDTENLSFAMARPNNAAYQSGLLSVTTQFLAFSHKAALAMLGQNPAISSKEVVKLWASGYVLFGANIFGARDYIRETLTGMGMGEMLDERLLDGSGATVIDLISAGLIQTIANKIMDTPVDTEAFTPVVNIKQFWEMTLEGIIRSPGTALLGPFGNRASAALTAMEFTDKLRKGDVDASSADKLMFNASMWMKNVFPQYNDITMAWMGYKHMRLYHISGESLALEPTMTAWIARGAFGARTMEEMAFYRLQDKIFDSDSIVKNMIDENRRFLTQYIHLYRRGEIDTNLFMDVARIVGNLSQDAPDGRVEEVIQGSFLRYYDDDDPRKTPMFLLGEAILEQKLTAAEAKDLLNQLPGTPEHKALLFQFVDESYDEAIRTVEQLRQDMVDQNPKLRE